MKYAHNNFDLYFCAIYEIVAPAYLGSDRCVFQILKANGGMCEWGLSWIGHRRLYADVRPGRGRRWRDGPDVRSAKGQPG